MTLVNASQDNGRACDQCGYEIRKEGKKERVNMDSNTYVLCQLIPQSQTTVNEFSI